MNSSIEIMKNRIVEILAGNPPSIYLYGSITLGDFKLGWSDIDILCLTKEKISDEQANRLLNLRQELLSEYKNNKFFRSFEGGFISLRAFINHTPDTVVYWGTGGQRITDEYRFGSFSMMELLDSGILLYGDDVRGMFNYPEKNDVIQAVINHYDIIRKYAVATTRSLYSAGWLLYRTVYLYA